MAYDSSLDKILAEQELSDYKIMVRVVSYDGGMPKLCFVQAKNEYPVKRIPIDIWEELQEVIDEVINESKQSEEYKEEQLKTEG